MTRVPAPQENLDNMRAEGSFHRNSGTLRFQCLMARVCEHVDQLQATYIGGFRLKFYVVRCYMPLNEFWRNVFGAVAVNVVKRRL